MRWLFTTDIMDTNFLKISKNEAQILVNEQILTRQK